MKKLLLLLILCAWPVTASAHPGKTDKYGGHMCLKGCEEWRLFYKEYHLHDKDGRPIRMSRKKTAAPEHAELLSAAAATVVLEPMSAAVQTVTVYRSVTTVYEEDVFFSNPLLWALLVLLLLLLLLRRNRKEPENPRP